MKPRYPFGVIRNSLLRAIRCCLTVALLVATSMSAGHASETTERFVREALRSSYDILNDETLSDEDRLEAFGSFLDTVVDFRRTALFTIGAYANRSDPVDIEAFVRSFRRYITATVKSSLQEVGDYSLAISGSSDRAIDDSIVLVALTSPQSRPGDEMQAAFRVRNDTAGDPIIVDIQFEGIWLAMTDRADYSSFLARNGGDLSALSQFLDGLNLDSDLNGETPD